MSRCTFFSEWRTVGEVVLTPDKWTNLSVTRRRLRRFRVNIFTSRRVSSFFEGDKRRMSSKTNRVIEGWTSCPGRPYARTIVLVFNPPLYFGLKVLPAFCL